MGSRKHRQKFRHSPEPSSPSPPQTWLWLTRPRPKLFLGLLLVGLTLVVYLQVSRFEIIDFDDADYVGDNLYVNQGLTGSSVAWAFSGFHFANWIPLTWLSLMLDASLFGRSPEANHVTNVILHVANVLLVFATFAKATGNAPRSAFVAALFAVHPLHVESVAWISERKDVLSMFFGLLALYSYVGYASGRRLMLLVVAWLMFACSLMAKQTFVTLPFLFLLLDYWPLARFTGEDVAATDGVDRAANGEPRVQARRIGRLVLEKIPFLALSAVFCLVAMKAQASGGAIPEWISLTMRLSNAVLVYGLYLWKALWPSRLAPFYPLPTAGPNVIGVGLSLAALAAITGFAIVNIRKRPYVITGWLWYLGTLVPVIGIVQIGRQQMADRYTYLPLLGIYFAVTWLVPSLIPEAAVRRRILPIAAVVAIVGYAVMGFVQCSYWHDGVTLFRRALAVTEDNPTTRRGLGSALFREERFQEARPHLEHAAKLDPNDAHAHYSLGRVLDAVGHPQEAFAEYQRAIALDEAYPDAQNDVGLSLVLQGKLAEAEQHFKRAIEIDPAYASGYGNLGMLYARLGQPEKAIPLCEKALQLDPGLLQCNQTIATALAAEGRLDEAIARLERLLRVEPGNQDARGELERITALKARRSHR
jgi:Tfp pilus assembly protein PilF